MQITPIISIHPVNIRIILLLVWCVSSCNPILENASQQAIPSPIAVSAAPATHTPFPNPTASPTPFPTSSPVEWLAAERIPMLEYHNPSFLMDETVMMTVEWFESQMRWLAENGYRTLTSRELVDYLDGYEFTQKSVILSFDIGIINRTEYAEIVIPALRRYDLHAIIFLVTNDQVGDDCDNGEYYCWQEFRSWVEEGLVSIESHGMYHKDFRFISPEMQIEDITVSKHIIEEHIGHPVLGFAFPYDGISKETLKLLESAGYQFAVGGATRQDRSIKPFDPDRYHLPRIYPYSNPGVYPVLSTAGGLTFEELIINQTTHSEP